MISRFSLALVLWAAAASASLAQEAVKSPEIVVSGTGSAKRPPDSAPLSGSIRGEGKTSTDALRAMADSRARIEDALKRLAGAESVEITTREMSVQGAVGPTCGQADYSDGPRMSEGPCAIQGYVATVKWRAAIRPAKKVGDAASLAAELGLQDVSVDEASLDDPSALRNEATASAMADARRKAEQIAVAGGVKLGPIVRVQDEQTRYGDYQSVPIAVTALRRNEAPPAKPAVPIDLAPPPVVENVSLIVTFSVIQ